MTTSGLLEAVEKLWSFSVVKDEAGGYVGHCTELDCYSAGNTETEAADATRSAARLIIDSYSDLRFGVTVEFDGEFYVCRCPELKGCVSYGDTIAEALHDMRGFQKLWIEDAKASKAAARRKVKGK